jgi:glycosyl transferase family 25
MSNNIDHIFFINLDKRTDRREHIENEMRKYNLNAERYSAIYTPHSGIIGCSFSHLNVLKLAKERGYKNVLILEDDFEFLVSKEEFELEIKKLFNSNIQFDVVMLSYIIQEYSDIPNCSFLKKVLNGQTASGYLVNGHYLDTLINLYEWSTKELEKNNEHWLYGNDACWKTLQPNGNWYFFVKKIGKQISDYSDNKCCYVVMND